MPPDPPAKIPKPSFEKMKLAQDAVRDEKKVINDKMRAVDDKIKKLQARNSGDDDSLAAARAALKV
jgi:hypothetical protein